MKINFLKRLLGGCFALLAVGFTLTSCSDDDNGGSKVFDPSQPVVVESFAPTTGPLATQVILSGKNFGTNRDSIHVYFNQKEAPVINSTGDKMLVMAPKLPGDSCVITVRVGNQTATAPGTFDYIIQTNVSTIVGGDKNATSYPTGTTNLAEVQFNHELGRPIFIDSEKNIYFLMQVDDSTNPWSIYVINEASGKLRLLKSGLTSFLNSNILAYNSLTDRVYRFYTNIGSNEYFYFDKDNDFAEVQEGIIDFENGDVMNPGGFASWVARQYYAMNPVDGMFYTRIYGGWLARFDPKTGEGANITPERYSSVGFGSKSGDTWGMVFDPFEPNVMYFSNTGRNCIYKFDLNTGYLSVYAGSSTGDSGYMDGERTLALFNSPEQIVIDGDHNMYISDCNNHCIRKIVMSTGYVSTVAGVPGVSGYVNGTGDVAEFDNPVGLAVDQDGILYVGDRDNRAIRRVAIE